MEIITTDGLNIPLRLNILASMEPELITNNMFKSTATARHNCCPPPSFHWYTHAQNHSASDFHLSGFGVKRKSVTLITKSKNRGKARVNLTLTFHPSDTCERILTCLTLFSCFCCFFVSVYFSHEQLPFEKRDDVTAAVRACEPCVQPCVVRPS